MQLKNKILLYLLLTIIEIKEIKSFKCSSKDINITPGILETVSENKKRTDAAVEPLHEAERESGSNGQARTGILRGICISEKKGIRKHPVPSITVLENCGIIGDAHAVNADTPILYRHRQVSLLARDNGEDQERYHRCSFEICGNRPGWS